LILKGGIYPVAVWYWRGACGAYSRSRRSRNDYMMELVSFSQLSVLIQPGVMLLVGFICSRLIPGLQTGFYMLHSAYNFSSSF